MHALFYFLAFVYQVFAVCALAACVWVIVRLAPLIKFLEDAKHNYEEAEVSMSLKVYM